MTSSKGSQATDVQRLNQALLRLSDTDYKGYLLNAVQVASIGKNFFQMPDGPGEDCVRTAAAIMRYFVKPSIYRRSMDVLSASLTKATGTRFDGTFQQQVRQTCEHIDQEVAKWPREFADFEGTKRNVRLPRPAINYIHAIPSGDQNIDDWLSRVPAHSDADLMKLEVVWDFPLIGPSADASKNEVAEIQAVVELAHSPTYGSTADRLLDRALHDFTAKDPPPQPDDRYYNDCLATIATKVYRYFLEDPLLGEEYEKTVDRIRACSGTSWDYAFSF